MKRYLKEHGLATEKELDAVDARVVAELERAWEAAKAAPWPRPEEALEDVYVSY